MRRRAVAIAAVLALLGVSGCGNSEDEYCGALKKSQNVFADDGSGLELIDNLPKLRALSKQAPDDLDDEWQTVLGALDALDGAIERAGVKPSDFTGGRPPAGLSQADKDKIAAAASEVSSEDVVSALTGIDQQARDVCKLQLGL